MIIVNPTPKINELLMFGGDDSCTCAGFSAVETFSVRFDLKSIVMAPKKKYVSASKKYTKV